MNMKCGHPINCDEREEHDPNTEHCMWCEEVDGLKAVNKTLHDQIGKQAVIVHGGEVTINAREIGCLTMHSGTVKVDSANLTITTAIYMQEADND